MKTAPIEAAKFVPADVPPHADALQQAQRVFLQGNGLPGRWAGRAQFVVLATRFGLGHHFLAAWQAWREDPQRCERLFFIAIEPHPLRGADLAQVHAQSAMPALAAQLQAAWPPLVPNLHRLTFEGGRVQLLLALGDIGTVLPALRLQADAFCLEGHKQLAGDPAAWEPRVLKALAAHAAPGATAASMCTAPALQEHLASAGFVPRLAPAAGGRPGATLANYAPRHTPHRLPGCAVAGRRAVVVGAGLAGAAAAQALAQAGWQVTVLERHAAPAQEASGNPGGLFHGTVNADDGPYARLFRAAALHAHATHALAVAQGVPGSAAGLLRLDARAGGLPALQAMLQRTGLPPAYVQMLGTEEASALAGLPLPAPAWHYPAGGWVEPAAWVRWALATPGVALRTGADVQHLQRAPGTSAVWQLLDGAGEVMAEADAVVLCNAVQAQALLAPLRADDTPPWPLRHTRGQVTQFPAAHPLRLPVAGDGYAIPLPGAVLCGATREAGAPGPATLRDADHQHNLQRLQRLTGLQPGPDAALSGRTGWRLHTDDRLPICGALPALQMPSGERQGQRADQARLLPREPGLFVLTALGARGLTLAPLLAQLVAAQASGTPWPLEQDLVDALDPGRWRVRAARQQPAGGPA